MFGLISHGLLAYQYQADSDSTKKGHTISVTQSVVASGKEELPFWFTSNNSSRLNSENYLGSWTQLRLGGDISKSSRSVNYFYEIEANAFLGSQTDFSLTQAYAGLGTRLFSVQLGAREEFFGLNDSTLSIGNLFYGNNARPVPKLVLSSAGWLKSPILGKHVSFRVYLAHGWLEKDRFQSKAFLHQKYFYIRAQLLNRRIQLAGGLNHSAQWSGKSEVNGRQPVGLADFGRIFFASSGADNANLTDQLNALGNHLGSYDLSASFRFKSLTVRNYWQFLWEDKSGLTPFNWRDGIMGWSIKSNSEKGLIRGFNLEIIRTNSQDAIKYDDDGNKIIEPDSFFNNSVYKSGWTYQGRVMANPVFLILNPGANTLALVKNMVNGFNIGLEGSYKQVSYQVNFRHFSNQGTFLERFSPALNLSGLEVNASMPLKQGDLGLRGVIEWGNYPGKNVGLLISYTRNLNLFSPLKRR